MKVHCPQCRTICDVPDSKTGENGIKTACGKCGAEITIRQESGEDPFSVIAMSPAYSRRRDAWIFLAAGVILILILAGGYLVFRGAEMPSLKIGWNPITSFLRVITGGEVYEACETFIRRNETLFQPLGGNVRVSLMRQSVKSFNGRKTATVLVKSQGEKARGQIYFQLRKKGDVWRVLSVAMKIGEGKFQSLYPRRQSGAGGKI